MALLSGIFGMSPVKRDELSRLLALEMDSYLAKIYRTMKRKVPLPRQKVSKELFILKDASLGATKAWEFRLNSREEAAKGSIGKIIVVTRGLEDDVIRKQRSLFMAAEFYVYHAFANHPDPAYFAAIRCQNQYWDMLKRLFRASNAHQTRDQAILYVIGEIKERKLAHFQGNGWYTSISKLDRHRPDIAGILGSSEKTFQEMFRVQRSRFSQSMLKQEEDLIRKEIEDLNHLVSSLREVEKAEHPTNMAKLIRIDLANIGTFRSVLESIKDNLDRWVVVDRQEHVELRKRAGISTAELHRLLQAESEAEQIDINKVHILFNHFKKEKINILRDLEMLDAASHRKAAHQA